MTNTTETFWSVDGVSLQTFAFNITTLGGDREAPPPVRDAEHEVPYMPGTRWLPGVEDKRVITLGMWVIGANEDGTLPDDEDNRRTYDRNWKMLRRLLYKSPRRQMTLTKRFWVPTEDLIDGGVDVTGLPTQGTWTLYTAVAKASYAGGLNPTMNGQARAVFTVDLRLNDPFFYSEAIEIPFSTAPADEDNPGPASSILVLGDGRTHEVEVQFDGPLTSPRIDNLSATDSEGDPIDLWLRYASVVPEDEYVVINAKRFSATHYPIGDSYKVSGFVQHDGDRFWLYLEPGETDLELSTGAGTGTAMIRYQPAWF